MRYHSVAGAYVVFRTIKVALPYWFGNYVVVVGSMPKLNERR
nr:MAG TPA: hypothetical protein [Caudoviricetes sp.]